MSCVHCSDSGIAGYEACVSLGGKHRDLNIRFRTQTVAVSIRERLIER
jgi:hypothetical protein